MGELKKKQKRNDLRMMKVIWALFSFMNKKPGNFHLLSPEELDSISEKIGLKGTQRLCPYNLQRYYLKKLKKIKVEVPNLVVEPTSGCRKRIGIDGDPTNVLLKVHKYVTVKYPEESWVLPANSQKEEKSLNKEVPVEKEEAPVITTTIKRPFGRKQFAIAALLSELGPQTAEEIEDMLNNSVNFHYSKLMPEDLIYPEFKILKDGKIQFVGELDKLSYNPKTVFEEPWWVENPQKVETLKKYFHVSRERIENIIIIRRDDSTRSRQILAKIIGPADYPIGKPELPSELKAGLLDSILLDAELLY